MSLAHQASNHATSADEKASEEARTRLFAVEKKYL